MSDPVKDLAREQYRMFAENPYGPGVDFHTIKGTKTKDVVAVNAGTYLKVQYRALGVYDQEAILDRHAPEVLQHPRSMFEG